MVRTDRKLTESAPTAPRFARQNAEGRSPGAETGTHVGGAIGLGGGPGRYRISAELRGSAAAQKINSGYIERTL